MKDKYKNDDLSPEGHQVYINPEKYHSIIREKKKSVVKITSKKSLGNQEQNTGEMICIKGITLKRLLFTIY